MKLNRLEVNGEIHCLYEFEEKVNVLLGANGTGKSTFVKLILYCLGAPIKSFIDEISKQGKCDNVTLDIECKSGKKFRILRKLPTSDIVIVTPVKNTEELVNDEIQAYNLEEFSDFLLENEGYSNEKIPYGKDKMASFRFYFLLRAVYVDQDTSAQQVLSSIEMNADYITSQPLIKKNIIEKLIGTDDLELQKLRLTLQELNKEQSEIGVEINFLKDRLYKYHKEKYDIEKINESLSNISAEKRFLSQQEFEKTLEVKALNDKRVSQSIIDLQKELNECETLLQTRTLEIEDINNVINTLEKDLNSLNYKIAAEEVISELPLLYCPNCLSPLDEETVKRGLCINCHKKTLEETVINNATIKRAIIDSINEAKEIKVSKEKELDQYHKKINEIEETLKQEKLRSLNECKNERSILLSVINEIKERLEYLIKTENNMRDFVNLSNSLHQKESIKRANAARMTDIKTILLDKDTELQKSNNRVQCFEKTFNKYCTKVFPDTSNCSIDDNFMPVIQGTKITNLASASMKVAVRLSFLTALLNYPLYMDLDESNHLNILLLDSPRDKELDEDKFGEYLQILDKEAHGQVIITGSLTDKEIYEKNLKNAKYFSELTDDKKLLAN